MKLRSTINTQAVEREIRSDAAYTLDIDSGLQTNFEYGQWWVTDLRTGAQWGVFDTEDRFGHECFGFEQVTESED